MHYDWKSQVPYRLFPVVHVSKLKRVKVFPDRPTNRLTLDEAYRIDFDEALLPEDSWEGENWMPTNSRWIEL